MSMESKFEYYNSDYSILVLKFLTVCKNGSAKNPAFFVCETSHWLGALKEGLDGV